MITTNTSWIGCDEDTRYMLCSSGYGYLENPDEERSKRPKMLSCENTTIILKYHSMRDEVETGGDGGCAGSVYRLFASGRSPISSCARFCEVVGLRSTGSGVDT
jgi:hypothetical protein